MDKDKAIKDPCHRRQGSRSFLKIKFCILSMDFEFDYQMVVIWQGVPKCIRI